jgi:predicted TIM-barrel fold metal-dependent hydrolase
MIFDFRTYIGESFDGTKQSIDELLTRMDSLHIDMALVCSLKPHSYDLDQSNRSLARDIDPHKDRFVGAVRIDPWQPDAAQTLRRGVESFGLQALYLNPWEETFRVDIDRVDTLLALAAQYKIPVLISAGYPWLSEALQVCNLATRWPTVSIIMTNGGQFNISGLGQADATLALKKCANLHFDTAGIYRQDFIEETVEFFGGERVFFGSGSPYFDQYYEFKRIQVAKISEENRQAIGYGNANHLLDFHLTEIEETSTENEKS